ncbi:uncharacterized protein LOC127847459 [Dreissena polymorpha]|uniref:Cadherin domain-containing protein n=1 Tax=Dreissena polymorpha TaxID=45954 RepID=A0A9D4I8V4_DREPO|nr:uncharacterized protein LOC127847459 [Dreissena polymorpha]KAH3751062.1 hypothetical protein DPMN_185605 [Dreissena polymorpha]
MTGLPGLVVILCLLQYSDGAVTFTGPGSPAVKTGDQTVTVSVVETSVDSATIFTVAATTDSGSVAFTFAADGNPDSIASSTITSGAVKLAAGKTLDKETKSSYTFKIVGTDSAGFATLTVTLTVTNKLEFAKTSYEVCVADGTVAGTLIGTYTAVDAVTGTDTVTYTNTPTTDLTVDANTGALKVTTGRALTSATSGGYTTTITADQTATTGAVSADGTTVVKVTVGGCSGAGQIQFMAILLLIPLLITRLF